MESGKRIRGLREELSLKASDIERITKSIADKNGNSDFYISHSTLADIETGSVPSIYKLFSLAVCLRIPLKDLLLPFGIDPDDVAYPVAESEFDALTQLPATPPTFRFQLNFDTNLFSPETALLRLRSEEFANLPSFFLGRLDPARYRYAVIGSRDDLMYDLLPPQSLVEIDTSQNQVRTFPWQTLRHRPIYLVWHSDGHRCCWCQVDGKELTLLPHPLSRHSVRRFKLPGEATVVGRVINAWLPFGAEVLPAMTECRP